LYWQDKLRFQAIRHLVTKIDCQPTAENGVILLVTGQLKVLCIYTVSQKCSKFDWL